VIRFMRRKYPEMRGIAWFNVDFENRGEEQMRSYVRAASGADRLFYEYYLMACVTLMPESLWITRDGDSWIVTAAVSNIGGMDSGPVSVEFLVDGTIAGRESASLIPAGPDRIENRVFFREALALREGLHQFEVRILSATRSTVLDASVTCARYIPGKER